MVEALAAHPDAAVTLAVAGSFAIYVEFLRPGLVVPGVLGAITLLTSVAALARNPQPSAVAAAGGLALWAVVTLYLVRVAVRARRNKMGG